VADGWDFCVAPDNVSIGVVVLHRNAFPKVTHAGNIALQPGYHMLQAHAMPPTAPAAIYQ